MEKIKIIKLGRKQQPSKFKPGETYSITTVMDDKNRKLAAMGKWAEDWKIGDVIEAEIEEKKWTDKDGFEQISLNIKNPKPFTPGAGRGFFNPKITAYQLAAALAPLFFKDSKKKITLKDIDELAEELKNRITVPVQPETTEIAAKKKEEVPEVDVDDEAEVEDENNDERPF